MPYGLKRGRFFCCPMQDLKRHSLPLGLFPLRNPLHRNFCADAGSDVHSWCHAEAFPFIWRGFGAQHRISLHTSGRLKSQGGTKRLRRRVSVRCPRGQDGEREGVSFRQRSQVAISPWDNTANRGWTGSDGDTATPWWKAHGGNPATGAPGLALDFFFFFFLYSPIMHRGTRTQNKN